MRALTLVAVIAAVSCAAATPPPVVTSTPTAEATPTPSSAVATPAPRVVTFRVDVGIPANVIVDVGAIRDRVATLVGRSGYQLIEVGVGDGSLSFGFDQPLADAIRHYVIDQVSADLAAARVHPSRLVVPQSEAAAHQVLPSVVLITSSATSSDFQSAATGFIIDRDGYILTAAHVLDATGTDPTVILYDGRRLRAQVVGVMKSGPDIAVLKVDAPDLTPVTFGDSDALRRGETLMHAGNPTGYGNWLVTGGSFVSATRIGATSQLRTDVPAAIGSSGSPLFDLRGRVVGLVIAIGGSPIVYDPSPFGIVWTGEDFARLNPKMLTLAIAGNDARASANAIIARQGNVP